MKTMIFAAGMAAVLLAGAAVAEQTQVRVAYDPSELASGQRADVLLGRLKIAALGACGADRESLSEYRQAVQYSACYRHKLDDAVAQVASPRLSRLYQLTGSQVAIAR